MEIDSAVWPGVSSAVSRTWPNSTTSPSRERRERVLRLGPGAEINRDAGAVAQLEVSGDEVGVKVREEDVRDPQVVLGREGEILIDVALRIDDGCGVRSGVADEVRSVRQAIQIKLLQDHRPPSHRIRIGQRARDTFAAPARPRAIRACRHRLRPGCGTIRMYGLGDFQPCG